MAHSMQVCACTVQVLPLTAAVAHGQLCACHKVPLTDAGPDGLAGDGCASQVSVACLLHARLLSFPNVTEIAPTPPQRQYCRYLQHQRGTSAAGSTAP